jgi:hypothetical protein
MQSLDAFFEFYPEIRPLLILPLRMQDVQSGCAWPRSLTIAYALEVRFQRRLLTLWAD